MTARYLSPSGILPRDEGLWTYSTYALSRLHKFAHAASYMVICILGSTHTCATLTANLLYLRLCRLHCPFVLLVYVLLKIPPSIYNLGFVFEVSLESLFLLF